MSRQHANIITTRYQSAKDLELAIERIQSMTDEVEAAEGFRGVVFVRTGETTTQHVALYDSQETAEAVAERMFPRFKEAVEPHVSEPPTFAQGSVLLNVRSS